MIGAETERADPAGHYKAHVAVVEVVFADRGERHLADLGPCGGDGEVDRFGRVKKAVDVLLESEDAVVIKPDSFKDAVSVKQAVVEDGDLRIRLRIEVPVDVDLERFSAHRGPVKGRETCPKQGGKQAIQAGRYHPKNRSTFFIALRKVSTSA